MFCASLRFRVAPGPVSRLGKNTQTASSRRASTSALVNKTSSTSSRSTYLTAERKRNLVSLYHEAENFVTLDNLSAYIDSRFARLAGGSSLERLRKDGVYALGAALDDQQSQPKTTVVSAGNISSSYSFMAIGDGSKAVHNALNIREDREGRLKKAVFGVDESKGARASFEMAEKRMPGGDSN